MPVCGAVGYTSLIFALRYDSLLNAMLLLGGRASIIVNNISGDA